MSDSACLGWGLQHIHYQVSVAETCLLRSQKVLECQRTGPGLPRWLCWWAGEELSFLGSREGLGQGFLVL